MKEPLPRWTRSLLLAGFAGALLVFIWSALIEPHLIIEEAYDAPIPDLPPEWEGERIALIADPQVGLAFSNTGTLRRIVARLIRMKPAAVFIAGDFIYEPVGEEEKHSRVIRDAARADIDEVVQLLRPLATAQIPMYAVLGNHDTETTDLGPPRSVALRDKLERVGIRVLIDEAVPLASSGAGASKLWLVGLSSERSRAQHRRAAFAQLPNGTPRLVLMHNPNRFEELPPGSAPLAMAGHTHGGQIKFPFLLLRRLLGRVHDEPRPIRGWMDNCGEPGNRLYINRGIGFSRLPLRFNAPPEITVFTLKRPASGLV